jgi:hypothetical protein
MGQSPSSVVALKQRNEAPQKGLAATKTVRESSLSGLLRSQICHRSIIKGHKDAFCTSPTGQNTTTQTRSGLEARREEVHTPKNGVPLAETRHCWRKRRPPLAKERRHPRRRKAHQRPKRATLATKRRAAGRYEKKRLASHC